MKITLTNTDDPRTHTFEEDDQILVLLKNAETGELFYRVLTYTSGRFLEACSLPVEFDFDDDFPELMGWEKIDI
ncbi:hypothetical protein [Parasutterella excrementihominis]|uniref:hypothetical protein n=1 Tax=Parasutterella excrementihominis TaxID=487175 RepID=UPI00242E5DF3|nr:hypothetical protein [Parasutterella excrementihominis]